MLRARVRFGLLSLLALGACGGRDENGGDGGTPFGPAEARALIPKAASMSGEAFDVILALGAAATPRDVEASGGVPLTAAVLVADMDRRQFVPGPALPPPIDDEAVLASGCAEDLTYDRGAATTPQDLAVGIRPVVEANGVARPRYPFASLILDEHIERVTCVRRGDEAHGDVTFRVPGAYRGRVEWSARRGTGGWQIVGFRLPHCGYGVVLEGERWRLVRDGSAPTAPVDAEIPRAALAVSTHAVDAPANPVTIRVNWEGALTLAGQRFGPLDDADPQKQARHLESFEWALTEVLRDPAARESDGASARDIVLRVHGDVPWKYVQWTLMSLASPRAKAYRIHFAFQRPGGEGVIACFLPRDESVEDGDRVTDLPAIKLSLFRRGLEGAVSERNTHVRLGANLEVDLPKGAWPQDRSEGAARRRQEELIWSQVTQQIAASWAQLHKDPRVRGELSTPVPKGAAVPARDVLQALDAFHAAGITRVGLYGVAAPVPKRR